MPTLFDQHHLVVAVIFLVIIVILQAGGSSVGAFLSMLLKKYFGKKDIEINLLGGLDGMAKLPKECEKCGLIVDPSKCVMHQSEHERSLRNEAEIAKIWTEYGKLLTEVNKLRHDTLAEVNKLRDDGRALRESLTESFARLTGTIHTSNSQILSALAGSRDGFENPSKGGRK